MSLRAALRRLPKREPPPEIWRRIEAGLAEHDRSKPGDVPSKTHDRCALHYMFAAAIAASVVLTVTLLIGRADAPQSAAPVQRVTDAVLEPPERSAAIAELLAESARLERVLIAFPRHDGVIRVATAGTIAGLEDQIAWIDSELSTSAALDDDDPMYQEVLWRERVEVMNALVDVHYAQVPSRVLLP